MKLRSFIVLLLLVLAPLAALAWLGARLARHEQMAAERHIEAALRGRLDDLAGQIDAMMEDRRRALLAALAEAEPSPAGLRELARKNPHIAQGFALSSAGQIIYPNPADPTLSEAEWAFLRRAQDSLSPGELLAASAEELSAINQIAGAPQAQAQMPAAANDPQGTVSRRVPINNPAQSQQMAAPPAQQLTQQPAPQQMQMPPPAQQQAAQMPQQPYAQSFANVSPLELRSGWYAWYWGRGAHVLLWRRDELGQFVGVELNGARLLADVIALLPDSTPESEKRINLYRSLTDGGSASRYYVQAELLRLVDTSGATLYQWTPRGPMTLADGSKPSAARPLAPPLHAWSLELHLPPGAMGAGLGRGTQLALAMGLAALALALGGMALYLWREQTRALREAAQRVTFVNQVSHELKTPLTNIRMYAEMMEDSLDELAEQPRRHLDVILAESRRLSRLIGNILSFARRQRNGLTLHPQPGVIDETVESVAGHFRPALEAQNISLSLQLGAPEPVRFDADVLEQILGNLLNNVEKYAPGAAVTISTRCEAASGRTIITVADTGPGIAPAHREKIFAPFYRISSRLTDGVAGTGIGLSIARDLARLHGGDLRLVKGDAGATFELTINAETE